MTHVLALRGGTVNPDTYTDAWLASQSDLALADETDRVASIQVDLNAQLTARKVAGRVPDTEYERYLAWKKGAVRFSQVLLLALRKLKAERRRRTLAVMAAGTRTDGRHPRNILADIVEVLRECEFDDPRLAGLLAEAESATERVREFRDTRHTEINR